MLRSILLGALCFFSATILIAQNNDYYWVDNTRFEITASNTHFIITADQPATLTGIKPTNFKRYESWAHKPFAILESNNASSSQEILSTLGLSNDDVSVSPGYALSDGFVIYPTQTIVAQLINKADKAAMEGIARKYGLK